MNAEQLKSIFESDYNRESYRNALQDIFHIQNLHSVPQPVELGANDFDAKAVELGYFETAEGLEVGLYEVEITPEKRLDRNKIGLRNLMRKVYQQDGDAALIVFTQGQTWRFTYASELTITNKETGDKEKKQTDPKRYTYILGRNQHCRTAAERFAGISAQSNLFETKISISEIEKAFSVDILTKDFYRELSNWYFWALTKIEFPDDAEPDREIRNSTNTIRLITRLIFVWFLKQKKLIPNELFEKDSVLDMLLLTDRNNSTYYKAILQNLFFATLNQEMGKRAFRNEGQHYNITTLFRYKRYFKDPTRALTLFWDIPFLNGGLFECLDKPHPTEKTPQGNEMIVRIDGFSDRDDNKICIPDYLFFGGAESVDLSEAYGENRQKNLKVRGLIDILNSYNFTVEENTPFDIQVALDPELLGKVFENLLASYNPETKTTARKQTGSFYTPREIVHYMVDESLKAYLTGKLTEKLEMSWCVKEPNPSDTRIGTTPEIEEYVQSQKDALQQKVTDILSYSEVDPELGPNEILYLIEAVDEIKVLDPACGSGAFPMGVLQQLVHILQKVDFDNRHWKTLQLQKAQQELQKAMGTSDADSFKATVNEIMEAFENNSNDYGRKLFLIENCIYGVDIQPIAVQIAKLRFFISLICEQDPKPDLPNLGIKPLPNLETKFVAANTLIGLDTSSTFKPDSVYALEKELEEVRHRHFNARTPDTKRKYRERDKELREKIAEELKNAGFPATSADQIANWNPYDQNTHAPFFDKYWMFGVEDGFDVVIGNPPWGAKLSTIEKGLFKTNYAEIDSSTPNSFSYFIGWAFKNYKSSVSYVLPDSILIKDFAKTRALIKPYISEIVWYENTGIPEEHRPFVYVEHDVCVMNLLKEKNENLKYTLHRYDRASNHISIIKYLQEKSKIMLEEFDFAINLIAQEKDFSILSKISKCVNISSFMQCHEGIHTGNCRETLFLDRKKNNFCRPLFYGGGVGDAIKNYKSNTSGWFVDYRSELINQEKGQYASLRDERIFKFPKIYITRTGNPFKAFYDESTYASNNFFSLQHKDYTKNEKRLLKYVLPFIISRIAQYFIRTFAAPRLGSTFIETKIFHLLKFRIPQYSSTANESFIQIVDRILSVKTENSGADTTALERQIEEMVYKLYELTYEEVKIIDPDFWLCEKEYNSIQIE